MGISDLLRNLQDVTTEMHISNFAGMRVAIDASGWMHKAVYATAEDWVDSNFADNQLYVDRLLNQVKSLQQCKVIPVMVFDGKRNTLKAETNEKRNEIKQSNIENARRLLESIGKTTDASARSKMRAECTKCFQGGLGVTHEMEKACIAGLQRCGVEVVVAPYEADPQLAYLCHVGHCDAVLTEDSDILVYSAVSGLAFPVLYKFNPSGSVQVTNLASCGILQATGKVGSPAGRPDSAEDISRAVSACSNISSSSTGSSQHVIDLEGIGAEAEAGARAGNKKKGKKESVRAPGGSAGFVMQLRAHFHTSSSGSSGGSSSSGSSSFSSSGSSSSSSGAVANVQGRRMFVQMCLLSGCDYSDSIPTVGPQTACQIVARFRDTADDLRLRKICDYFKLSGKRVADTYLTRVLQAEQLFFYHPVYNPITDTLEHFNCAEGTSWAPSMTAEEKDKLGGSLAHLLVPQRKDGTSLAPNSSLTLRDVCLGHYSIKDHTQLKPLLPWERNSALCSTSREKTNAAWNQRRMLMHAMGYKGNGSNGNHGNNNGNHGNNNGNGNNYIRGGHHQQAPRPPNPISNNPISSFMLSGSSRPPSAGAQFGGNSYASAFRPSPPKKGPINAFFSVAQAQTQAQPPAPRAAAFSLYPKRSLYTAPGYAETSSGAANFADTSARNFNSGTASSSHENLGNGASHSGSFGSTSASGASTSRYTSSPFFPVSSAAPAHSAHSVHNVHTHPNAPAVLVDLTAFVCTGYTSDRTVKSGIAGSPSPSPGDAPNVYNVYDLNEEAEDELSVTGASSTGVRDSPAYGAETNDAIAALAGVYGYSDAQAGLDVETEAEAEVGAISVYDIPDSPPISHRASAAGLGGALDLGQFSYSDAGVTGADENTPAMSRGFRGATTAPRFDPSLLRLQEKLQQNTTKKSAAHAPALDAHTFTSKTLGPARFVPIDVSSFGASSVWAGTKRKADDIAPLGKPPRSGHASKKAQRPPTTAKGSGTASILSFFKAR